MFFDAIHLNAFFLVTGDTEALKIYSDVIYLNQWFLTWRYRPPVGAVDFWGGRKYSGGIFGGAEGVRYSSHCRFAL